MKFIENKIKQKKKAVHKSDWFLFRFIWKFISICYNNRTTHQHFYIFFFSVWSILQFHCVHNLYFFLFFFSLALLLLRVFIWIRIDFFFISLSGSSMLLGPYFFLNYCVRYNKSMCIWCLPCASYFFFAMKCVTITYFVFFLSFSFLLICKRIFVFMKSERKVYFIKFIYMFHIENVVIKWFEMFKKKWFDERHLNYIRLNLKRFRKLSLHLTCQCSLILRSIVQFNTNCQYIITLERIHAIFEMVFSFFFIFFFFRFLYRCDPIRNWKGETWYERQQKRKENRNHLLVPLYLYGRKTDLRKIFITQFSNQFRAIDDNLTINSH